MANDQDKDYVLAAQAESLIDAASKNKEVRPRVLIRVLKVLLVVAPVNFIVASGPLLIALVALALGWSASALIAGGAAYAALALKSFDPAVVFFLLGILGIGVLALLAMTSISRVVFAGLAKWLKWNLRFLMGNEK